MKTTPVKCNSNRICEDGRLEFKFQKGTESTTNVSPTSPVKIVVPADVDLTILTDAANNEGWAVGKQYNLQLIPIN